MTVTKLIELIGAKSGEWSFWGIVLLLLSIGVEFTPIKWNPWSAILGWIGSRLNSRLSKELKDLNTKVDKLSTDLDKHIKESEKKEIQDTRRDILNFCNACMNGQKHTREQFEFVIKQCDNYETYIQNNKIKNGVVDAAIKEIRRLNQKCIEENSYLKEGEDYEVHA